MANNQKPTLNQADIDLLRGIFATKDDLNTQRDEITSAVSRYFNEVGVTKEEFNELKEAISHLPTKDEYFAKMDKISGEYKDFSTEAPNLAKTQSSQEERIEDLSEKAGNHEDRITQIESSPLFAKA